MKTAEQLTTHDGKTVSVFGVYERLGAAKPTGGGEPAGVRLADGTLVLLGIPGTPSGARPASEVEEHAGERVVATGIVVSTCPPDASGGASATDPCFPTGAHVTTQAFHELVWGD